MKEKNLPHFKPLDKLSLVTFTTLYFSRLFKNIWKESKIRLSSESTNTRSLWSFKLKPQQNMPIYLTATSEMSTRSWVQETSSSNQARPLSWSNWGLFSLITFLQSFQRSKKNRWMISKWILSRLQRIKNFNITLILRSVKRKRKRNRKWSEKFKREFKRWRLRWLKNK